MEGTVFMRKRFCPDCGATSKPFIENVCIDCFQKKNKLLMYPEEIEVMYCRECAKVLRQGKWVPPSEDHLLELVRQNIKSKSLDHLEFDVGLEPQDDGSSVASGHVKGLLGSEEISVPVSVSLEPRETLCRKCSLVRADYFEAKIQFRFESKDKNEWQKIVDEFESRLDELYRTDSLAQVAKKELISNGVDVRVGSKRAAKTIVDELSKKYRIRPVTSFTLAGVDKSGRTRKNFTFLLRFNR